MIRRMNRLGIPGRGRSGGFALLEVIVAMVILGISIATIMRSFTLSLAAIRKNDAGTHASVLAETLLQNLEADPPTEKKTTLTGDFSQEGFPEYGYQIEIENEKIKYRLNTKTRIDGLRDLKIARLQMTYENSKGEITNPLDGYLILPPLERFSYESKRRNELFSEEEGIQQ